jgi:MOSC domain-containing protein YiiM
MDPVTEATAVAGKGLVGDVTTSRRRHVTIIEREAWDAMMAELGANVSPVGRRANLMVSGVQLHQTRGKVLRIGAVRLAIGGETTPCERMDEYLPGLRDVMRPHWRGGVFAQVLDDGLLAVGDSVAFDG